MHHDPGTGGTVATLDCCPPLVECDQCETLDVRYRLPFRPTGRLAAQARVAVTLLLEKSQEYRCCPEAKGDGSEE
jgi:hypothetical protein